MRRMHWVGLALAAAVLAGACGSSKNNTAAATTTPPTTEAATTTTTAAPETTTTAAPATTTTAPAQTMTATPNTGLKDGQAIHIVAKGYTPGEKDIGVTECADKGNNTMAGDCDLKGIKIAIPDASGTVTIDFPVKKGPFGGNLVTCSAAQPCLVSVAQETASPTEVATVNITFA